MKYTATRLGFKVYEVPIVFTDRVLGTSKMSMKIFKEAFFGVFKQGFQDRGKVVFLRSRALGQFFAGTGPDGPVLRPCDVGHELFTAVKVYMKAGLQLHEPRGKAVHADKHAWRGAGNGADFPAALLEHLREAVVHALGQPGVLADTAGREPAVHAIVFGIDDGRFPQQRISRRGEGHTIGLGLGEDVTHHFVGCVSAPVAAGAVAAIMTDVERFIALGRGRIHHIDELVRMRVESSALREFLEELNHLGALLLGVGRP